MCVRPSFIFAIRRQLRMSNPNVFLLFPPLAARLVAVCKAALHPRHSRAQLAWSYAVKGMYPQALAEYDKIAEPDKSVATENQLVADGLGWVYAVSGRRADALKIAKEVEELSPHAYVDFYQLATIYAGLGEKDEAFRLLEKGYEERSAGMPYLAVDPFWFGMRSDPRYADLLRRMDLPQPKDPLLVKRYTGLTSTRSKIDS
jgi:tetratricopeptide (TPR) repeat protein